MIKTMAIGFVYDSGVVSEESCQIYLARVTCTEDQWHRRSSSSTCQTCVARVVRRASRRDMCSDICALTCAVAQHLTLHRERITCACHRKNTEKCKVVCVYTRCQCECHCGLISLPRDGVRMGVSEREIIYVYVCIMNGEKLTIEF